MTVTHGDVTGQGTAPGPTGAVDWSAAWRSARARRERRGGSEAWDRRAPSFARRTAAGGYVERMLELIHPEPGWTVLDVGSGAGTLAVPLARLVREVIALDFSPRMLALLRGRCAEEGLSNVAPVLGAWEDDWARLGIGGCDLALASRSLAVDDLRQALVKLHRVARRRVVVSAPVGEGPVDRRVVEAVGRRHEPGPDYLYPYHLLRQLGIEADLAFIPVTDTPRYASQEEALARLRWMTPQASEAELARLRAWLEGALVPVAAGFELPPPRTVCWAVLSWSTEQGS